MIVTGATATVAVAGGWAEVRAAMTAACHAGAAGAESVAAVGQAQVTGSPPSQTRRGARPNDQTNAPS
jgi:hypothetical protein